jgi:hypothetical protein
VAFNIRNVFLIVLEAGCPRSRHQERYLMSGEGLLSDSLAAIFSLSSHSRRIRKLSRVASIKELLPFIRALLNYLPTAPSS